MKKKGWQVYIIYSLNTRDELRIWIRIWNLIGELEDFFPFLELELEWSSLMTCAHKLFSKVSDQMDRHFNIRIQAAERSKLFVFFKIPTRSSFLFARPSKFLPNKNSVIQVKGDLFASSEISRRIKKDSDREFFIWQKETRPPK